MEHDELFKFALHLDTYNDLIAKPPSREWLTSLSKRVEIIEVEKKQIISAFNEVPKALYFLQKGAARGYCIDARGKECSVHLWNESTMIGDTVSFLGQSRSDIQIEVLGPTTLLKLSRTALTEVTTQFPNSSLFVQSILLRIARHYKTRCIESITLSAQNRYKRDIASDSRIQQTFADEQIASYYGRSRSWVSKEKQDER